MSDRDWRPRGSSCRAHRATASPAATRAAPVPGRQRHGARAPRHPAVQRAGTWTSASAWSTPRATTATTARARSRRSVCPRRSPCKPSTSQAPSAHVPRKVAHAGPVVVTFSEPTLWKGSTVPINVRPDDVYQGRRHLDLHQREPRGGGLQRQRRGRGEGEFAPTAPLTVGRHYVVESSHGIYDTFGNGPAYVSSEFRAT